MQALTTVGDDEPDCVGLSSMEGKTGRAESAFAELISALFPPQFHLNIAKVASLTKIPAGANWSRMPHPAPLLAA